MHIHFNIEEGTEKRTHNHSERPTSLNQDNLMINSVNPYVSVDCVLLGFDGDSLNVLVVRQTNAEKGNDTGCYKLPGSLINMDEDLDDAAQRVLKQLTGLVQVKMVQFKAFGGANRLANPRDSI